MDVNSWGILCGAIMVILLTVVRGICYKKWRQSLGSIIEIFMLGAMIPFVISLFLFSFSGKPEISFEQCRIYLALVSIVTIYHTILRVIEEIKQR